MNVKAWVVVMLMVAVAFGVSLGVQYVMAGEAAPAAPGEPAAPPAEPAAPGGAPEAKAPAPTTAAPAEPGGARAREPKYSITLLDVLHKGGWIGYIIVALSFVSLSLCIEHAVSLRRAKLCPPELADELQDYFNEERYEEALELCNVERNVLTDVVRAGLSRIDSGYERMQEAMAEAGEEASITLQQKISWLSLVGNIAPMLGLYGTVSGMIGAFGKIALMTVVKPSVLAGNINEALVTTFQGLSVAIPTMCAYQFFANRVMRIILETGTVVSDLMDRFKPAK